MKAKRKFIANIISRINLIKVILIKSDFDNLSKDQKISLLVKLL